ncbi:MAG: hypothetical protein A2Y57_03705 [Candidatus Woykebacteria bacterium RBG_13_40_7b]|uniref:ATP-grasp domain-containing protein n=1 Tax=Candidatus Woykebacteria bacterium RBG_13_40_7b TaxID=1802594 RepID=A0A1G1WBM8_9BACT|nr:MAG: hypothetical protein A2Y57_03705 [Candidatus Woykebacteria bacterium RBG_13_40_7b]
MKLYEFEGKKLFKEAGIPVPDGLVVSSTSELKNPVLPLVVKAQTLSSGRGKNSLIIPCKDIEELKKAIKNLYEKETNGEKIEKFLVERYLVDKKAEYYLAITYSTTSRSPIVLVSKKGGIDIEEITKENSIFTLRINPSIGLLPWMARQVLSEAGFEGIHFLSLTKILVALWEVFTRYDARLVEINPLIETGDEEFYAADAKVILDDEADFRRPEPKLPPRDVLGRSPSDRESEAREIDANDHRGSAGSSYFDLDGDIAIIAAGGGGSVVCMDALVALGGNPANYTEHSGNPPAEKLKKLTKIVLSKPGLNGCWFVGATANFTDIYETLRGFVEGLRETKLKPTFPIVIRRGGPRYEEAFEMLKEVGKKEGYDFHIFGPETPMTSTTKVVLDLVNKYKQKK